MPSIDVVVRRAWDWAPLLFIIGPGGAGKSTLAQLLAPQIKRLLIDLDQVFYDRISPIGSFITMSGYAAYKRTNSDLAQTLVAELTQPCLLVTSSGFLALDNPPEALAANRALLARGYSISLLPDADADVACDIIVRRQLARGFTKDRAREYRTIRERFPLYAAAGDMLVISAESPERIAAVATTQLSLRITR